MSKKKQPEATQAAAETADTIPQKAAEPVAQDACVFSLPEAQALPELSNAQREDSFPQHEHLPPNAIRAFKDADGRTMHVVDTAAGLAKIATN